jgi:hypothetical protein
MGGCDEAQRASPQDKPVTKPPVVTTGKPHSSASPSAAPAAPSAAPLPPTLPSLEGSLEPLQHEGPFFMSTSSSVGIYPDTGFSRRDKIGYMRRGGKVAVLAPVQKKDNCEGGWHEVVGGGYVCGNYGTIDPKNPKASIGTSAPNLKEILPYRYARNSKNGTPLYKSVPSAEQMNLYEPYLKAEKAEKAKAEKEKAAAEKNGEKPSDTKKASVTADPASSASAAPSVPSAAAAIPSVETLAAPPPPVTDTEGGDEGEKSWWEQDNADDHLHKLKKEDLTKDQDDILAMRMVKGFYVAIDKIFNWNGRTWYKTTEGMIAPADRFWMTDASDFAGTELTAEHNLPLGWVYGWQKERPKFEINPESKQATPVGNVKHFEVVTLTGDELTVGKTRYVAATDGTYLKKEHLRIPEPGEPPKDLAPDERWIEVDLSSQTVIAYIGHTPVFATLISSGKESKDKDKDHRTPTGEWRIREKHITTTMDGDGTAAGDMPYSIEDVPYVMYFHKAYALHGAFWHRNYGTRMSHGCINLAPLDAKRLFFFSAPQVPFGWHGAWSRDNKPGTRVVVKD